MSERSGNYDVSRNGGLDKQVAAFEVPQASTQSGLSAHQQQPTEEMNMSLETELNDEQAKIDEASNLGEAIQSKFLANLNNAIASVRAGFVEDFYGAINEARIEELFHEDLLIALERMCASGAGMTDFFRFRVALSAYCAKKAAHDLRMEIEREHGL